MKTTRRAFRRPPQLTKKERTFLRLRSGRVGKLTPAQRGVVDRLLAKKLLAVDGAGAVRLTRKGHEALVC